MSYLEVREYDCINRLGIPEKGITVIEDLKISNDRLNLLKEQLTNIEIYKREKEDCPFNRGNWICDQYYGDNIYGDNIFCIKLPIEMEEEDVMKFFKPLIDIVKSKLN